MRALVIEPEEKRLYRGRHEAQVFKNNLRFLIMGNKDLKVDPCLRKLTITHQQEPCFYDEEGKTLYDRFGGNQELKI